MESGERHPIASHGEILQEKFAPNMLSLALFSDPLSGFPLRLPANFLSLYNASVSPPIEEASTAVFPFYKMRKYNVNLKEK